MAGRRDNGVKLLSLFEYVVILILHLVVNATCWILLWAFALRNMMISENDPW